MFLILKEIYQQDLKIILIIQMQKRFLVEIKLKKVNLLKTT